MKLRVSVWRSLLCFCILFSLIFSSTLSVSASEQFVYNYYWDIETYGNLGYSATDINIPIEYENVNGTEYAFYYRVLNLSFLCNASENAYAYKVIMSSNLGNVCNQNSMVMSVMPIVGTYSDIYNGIAQVGEKHIFQTVDSSYDVQNSWFWVPTNGTDEALYCAMLIRCRSYDSTTPFLDYSGEITVNLYEYTKTEYDSEILKSVEEQNTIANNQLAESQKQTSIQEDILTEQQEQTEIQQEQLETEKGFFESFFGNLQNLIGSLFVPQGDEVSKRMDEMSAVCEEHLGILYTALTYFGRIIEALMTESEEVEFKFSAFSILGHKIWDDYYIKVSDYPLAVEVFGYCRVITGVLIVSLFIRYLRRQFDRFFGS